MSNGPSNPTGRRGPQRRTGGNAQSGPHHSTSEALFRARLDENRDLLQKVLDHSPSLITVKSTDGSFLFVNEPVARWVGLTRDEILTMKNEDFLPAELAQRFRAEELQVIQTGRPRHSQEVSFRRGSRKVVNIVRYPLKDDNDEVFAICHVATDVTSEVTAEEARRAERIKLAVDLHDDAVQVMASHALRLDLLLRTVEDERLRARLVELEGSVRGAVARLRDLMSELTSPVGGQGSLAGALETILEDASSHDIETHLDLQVGELPEASRTTIYRIAKEAVTNAIKHAAPGRIEIVVAPEEGGTVTTITDDGSGFVPHEGPPPGHVGISAMRLRAERVGGRVEVLSAPGEGTQVRAWLPVTSDREEQG